MNRVQKLLKRMKDIQEDSLSVREPISTVPDDPAVNPVNPLREVDDPNDEEEDDDG